MSTRHAPTPDMQILDPSPSPTGGARILIVERDAAAAQALDAHLVAHGFDVHHAAGADAMRGRIAQGDTDLVLLGDHADAVALARFLRERHRVAIVMIGGTGGMIDRVVGLEAGADDCLTQPFDPRELVSRLRSVLRRTRLVAQAAAAPEPEPASRGVRFGRCWFHADARRLCDPDGAEVPLTAMEFELLHAFAANPNRVLSRDQLLRRARRREWEPFDRSVDIRVGRLRRKVEPVPGEARTIRTVRGGGYMYVPGVAVSAA